MPSKGRDGFDPCADSGFANAIEQAAALLARLHWFRREDLPCHVASGARRNGGPEAIHPTNAFYVFRFISREPR